MQKRTSRLPFLGFLLLFVVPIAAAFLLAHDARNLKQVLQWAGLPVEAVDPPPSVIPQTVRPVLPAHQGEETATRSKDMPLDQRLAATPAALDELSAGLAETDPASRCRSLTRLTRAVPDFVVASGVWTCLAELRYPRSEDVLFLHVVGEGATMHLFRAKLNLYDGRSLPMMAMDMAKALGLYEPVDLAYVAQRVQQTAEQDRDAEWLFGYGRIRIERETGDIRRFNIFIRRDMPPDAPATPGPGFRSGETSGLPVQ